MQSILSVSSAQTATSEANYSHKATQSSRSADEKIETEKESARFSDVMEGVSEEEALSDAEQEVEEGSEEIAVQEAPLDVESTLEGGEELALKDVQSIEVAESVAESAEEPLVLDAAPENERLDKAGNATAQDEESSKVSSNTAPLTDNKAVLASESEETQKVVNPILAQIETAKKVDTKITEVKADSAEEGADMVAKTTNKWFEETEKGTKLNAAGASVQNEDSETLAPLSNKLDSQNATLKSPLINTITGMGALNSELATGLSSTTTAVDNALLTATTNSGSTPLASTQAAAAQATTAQTTLLQQLQQPIQLYSQQLSAVLGERIMMMVNQGKHEVSIRLDPAELGSMQIKLQVHQEQLQLAIHAQAAQSRDIIEQNLPRLREQLAQQGINLGEANVEQQAQQQSDAQHPQGEKVAMQSTQHGADPLLAEQTEWLNTQIPIPAQGIDFYA